MEVDKIIRLVWQYNSLTPIGKAFMGMNILTKLDDLIGDNKELKQVVSGWLF